MEVFASRKPSEHKLQAPCCCWARCDLPTYCNCTCHRFFCRNISRSSPGLCLKVHIDVFLGRTSWCDARPSFFLSLLPSRSLPTSLTPSRRRPNSLRGRTLTWADRPSSPPRRPSPSSSRWRTWCARSVRTPRCSCPSMTLWSQSSSGETPELSCCLRLCYSCVCLQMHSCDHLSIYFSKCRCC